MSSAPPPLPPPGFDIVQFAKATRFALASIVLCLSCFVLRSSLAIEDFDRIFHDMLGGKPLPPVTQWLLHLRLLILLVSMFIPLIALATLSFGNLARAVTILGWLVIVAFIECLLIYQGLTASLIEIIKQMGGTA